MTGGAVPTATPRDPITRPGRPSRARDPYTRAAGTYRGRTVLCLLSAAVAAVVGVAGGARERWRRRG